MKEQQENVEEKHYSTENQYIGFYFGEEEFGLEILDVREIIEMKETTDVPRTSDHIEGIINLRGNVIPIINLREKFGLTSGETLGEVNDQNRIIVVEYDDFHAGFIVEGVSGVIHLNPGDIASRIPILEDVDRTYFNGVAKLEDRLIVLLDLEGIFRASEREELQELGDH